MAGSRYHRVRGLEKGLALLRALNSEGESSASRLAAVASLPRPTVHRLLETLVAAGYVARGRVRGIYRLAPLVRALSEGYRDDDWISDIAEPVLREFAEEIVWPTDIATYDNGTMVIRASTHARSPLSIHRAVIGARYPLLNSSIGLAYLAFCPAGERAVILELLAKGATADADMLRGRFAVERILRETRARGYGVRRASAGARTSSIAVPVMDRRRVLACINVVWIHTALSVDAAVRRYLPVLKKIAKRIEADYRTQRR